MSKQVNICYYYALINSLRSAEHNPERIDV